MEANWQKYPLFDSAISLHTRDICDPHYNTWKDVPKEHQKKIQNHMLVFTWNKTYPNNLFEYSIYDLLT